MSELLNHPINRFNLYINHFRQTCALRMCNLDLSGSFIWGTTTRFSLYKNSSRLSHAAEEWRLFVQFWPWCWLSVFVKYKRNASQEAVGEGLRRFAGDATACIHLPSMQLQACIFIFQELREAAPLATLIGAGNAFFSWCAQNVSRAHLRLRSSWNPNSHLASYEDCCPGFCSGSRALSCLTAKIWVAFWRKCSCWVSLIRASVTRLIHIPAECTRIFLSILVNVPKMLCKQTLFRKTDSCILALYAWTAALSAAYPYWRYWKAYSLRRPSKATIAAATARGAYRRIKQYIRHRPS